MNCEDEVYLCIKWGTRVITLENICLSRCSIFSIKEQLFGLTGVPIERQKLLGLVKAGRRVDEAKPISDIEKADLSLKTSLKDGKTTITCSLLGTPDSQLIADPSSSFASSVMNDFSHSFSPETEEWRMLQKHTDLAEINFINEHREGKKLLILDLDHTLLDFSDKDTADPVDMKRPYLDYFLTEVYAHYDIAIWSQTSWKWLEIKLIELGLIMSPSYKLCFVLDKKTMFKLETGYVKPLHIIWSKFPQWNRGNTLHIDDLERNFAMNPESGVLVSPFRR